MKIRWLLIGIILILAIYCIVRWVNPYDNKMEITEKQTESTQVIESSEAPLETTQQEIIEETEEVVEEYQSPIDFEELRLTNEDVIGWIRIPDTNIDYPIVQTSNNEYYLDHDLYKEISKYGAIYLDYESEVNFIGYNNVLYGHNMKNGSMFRDVVKYKEEDFFKSHQYFEIYTPERTIYLKAVSCYYDEAKTVYRKMEFADDNAFDLFVHEILSPCTYAEIPEGPVDSLFVLITCSYEVTDARTFLFAVEVDEERQVILAEREDLKPDHE